MVPVNQQFSLPKACREALVQLVRRGVAVLHDGEACRFVAHRTVSGRAVLNAMPPESVASLSHHLPEHTLFAPLSQEQLRTVYHSEVLGSAMWNIHHVHRLPDGDWDIDILRRGMALMVANQDILRTCFVRLGDELWTQAVMPESSVALEQVAMPDEVSFRRFIGQERGKHMDVGCAPLLKAWFCCVGNAVYMGFVAHHGVADAFTTTMMLSEMLAYHDALKKGVESDVHSVGEQYWQYALGQFDKDVYRDRETLRYWKMRLAGDEALDVAGCESPVAMKLPYAVNPHMKGRSAEGGGYIRSLDGNLCQELNAFCRDHDCTFATLFTAALIIAFLRGMGNDRAIFQLVNSQRDTSPLWRTLGDFTNILFTQYGLDALPSDQCVAEVLRSLHLRIARDLQHAKVSFDDLLSIVGLDGLGAYHEQVCDVVVNSTDLDAGGSGLQGGQSVTGQESDVSVDEDMSEPALATLFFQIIKSRGRLHLITAYKRHLFDAVEMRDLSALVVRIVAALVGNPDTPLGDVLSVFVSDFEGLGRQADRYRQAEGVVLKKLSEGQKGLWWLHELDSGMSAYNIPVALRVPRQLDAEILQKGMDHVVGKHRLLLTMFTRDGAGMPLQYVDETQRIIVHEHDAVQWTAETLETALREVSKAPFNLEQDPLMRVHCYHTAGEECVLLMVVHHIVFDGASINVFTSDLLEAYEVLSQGRVLPEVSPRHPVFHDFIDWERRYMSSDAASVDLAYWKEQLDGGIPRLDMPLDSPRPAHPSHAGTTCSRVLPRELSDALHRLAKGQEVSLFVLLLSAYTTLLHRYTRQTDIVVGVPVVGRPESQFADSVGYYVNTVPLRTSVQGETLFPVHLKEVQRMVAHGLDHANYPFPKLVSELKRHAGDVHASVYQTLFALQNATAVPGGVQEDIIPVAGLHQEGDHDLSLEAVAGADMALHLSYNTDIFHEASMERFMDHYTRLLGEIVRDPYRANDTYTFLLPQEEKRLVYTWNDTAYPHPVKKLVHQLFKQQVRKTPDAPAVLYKSRVVSYRQLNDASLQLAKHLSQQGVFSGDCVGVCMERSPEMIVALLAVMKVGGVLVPIPPDSPVERMAHILDDCRAVMLVTDNKLRTRWKKVTRDMGCALEVMGNEWLQGKRVVGRLVETQGTSDPAYVVYTSGTTGTPKGVQVSHGSFLLHCLAVRRAYRLGASDRILQFAPLGVDAALEQIFPGLMAGAALVLMDQGGWTVKQFRTRVKRHKISVADIPPSYLNELLRDSSDFFRPKPPRCLQLVICGGEALKPETVRMWVQASTEKIRLLNAYGPTETTITSTLHEVVRTRPEDVDTVIPIGMPLDNERAYILDTAGNPCPVGVPGELHIGGAGVAMGYLNRPQLTQEAFLPDPFILGERMYRTGDWGRRRDDGYIEYLGRMDKQIKVRGFRVELSEVASVLASLDGIHQAVVAVAPGVGGNRLVAFAVPVNSEAPPQWAVVKNALEQRLPSYMIPVALLVVDRVPLTQAGKTDTQALLRLFEARDIDRQDDAPCTETETVLVDIWQNALGMGRVGVHDDFFEVGGHSLLAVRLLAEVEKRLSRSLSLATLFKSPSIAQLARTLDEGKRVDGPHANLIPLASGGSEPPLFCVHPVSGHVAPYLPLAERFAGVRPVYGLQAPGLNGEKHPGSVEGLASLYRQAVMTVQPDGPWHLAGWSMGGVVAYEMVRQWEHAGERVSQVTMIDSYAPHVVRVFEERARKIMGLEVRDPDVLDVLAFAEELGVDLAKTKKLLEKNHKKAADLLRVLTEMSSEICSVSQVSVDEMTHMFRVFQANLRALSVYEPVPIKSSVNLLSTGGETGAVGEGPETGWAGIVGSHWKVIPVSGTHYTVMEPSKVVEVHGQIEEHLLKADRGR